MYIETPILIPDDIIVDGFSHEDWFFCGSIIREHFELPKKVTQIQFRAHQEQKPGRIKVQFGVGEQDDHDLVDGFETYYCILTWAIISKLIGSCKTWYVELYYWE